MTSYVTETFFGMQEAERASMLILQNGQKATAAVQPRVHGMLLTAVCRHHAYDAVD